MTKKEEKKIKKANKMLNKLAKSLFGNDVESIEGFTVNLNPIYVGSVNGDKFMIDADVSIDFKIVKENK